MDIGDAEEYHDDLKLVIVVNNGVEVSRRPYTEEEIAQVSARAAQTTNATTLTSDAANAISTMLVTINGLQAIIDKPNAAIGPGDTKDIARALKAITRQLVRLTRLLVNKLESSDVGLA